MNRFHALAVARASLPRLTLAQRVVDKIVANALVYETETGESLVGLAVKSLGRVEPDLYVLETIPPDETAIRRGAYFEQGDDLQGDTFNWWYDNWQQFRDRRRGSYGNAIGAKWDVPLANLGDWHKHPGTLVEPSGGDFGTAREHIFDSKQGIPQVLVVLATVWSREEADSYDIVDPTDLIGVLDPEHDMPQPLKIPVNDNLLVRIDCWYMSRLTKRFVRLTPMVVPDKSLPSLPIIGWHLNNQKRLQEEVAALEKDGYSINVEQVDGDQLPPLEICFHPAKRTSKNILFIVTQADYPAEMPKIRFTPLSLMKEIPEGANLFDALWKKSQPVPQNAYPTWQWTPDRMISDLVREVEERLLVESTPST